MKRLTAAPKKKPKKTRSEIYATNYKHFGEEPVYNGQPMGMAQKARALTWYASMCDVGDAREYAEEFLATQKPELIDGLKRVADTSFPLTASYLARMHTQGAFTDGGTKSFILNKFEEAIRKYAGRSEEKLDPEEVSAA